MNVSGCNNVCKKRVIAEIMNDGMINILALKEKKVERKVKWEIEGKKGIDWEETEEKEMRKLLLEKNCRSTNIC